MKYLGMMVLLAFTACNTQGNTTELAEVNGSYKAISEIPFTETYSRIKSSLLEAAPITIVAEVDHKSNANGIDQELNEAKTIFFGNPALGTPFMQENQQAGLDLPQKIAVYTTSTDKAVVIYNSVDYLMARHGVNPATAPMVATALNKIASNATQSEPIQNKATVARDEGVITVNSNQSFENTYSSLITLLSSNPAITIVAELDHQKNAMSVGLNLRPTRVVIFGNPALGTPLLQETGTVSLDLPQKMLLYQDAAGNVILAYNDAAYIAKRHGIPQDDRMASINAALSNIASKAAGK